MFLALSTAGIMTQGHRTTQCLALLDQFEASMNCFASDAIEHWAVMAGNVLCTASHPDGHVELSKAHLVDAFEAGTA